jgi:hypothetical protein
MLDIDSTVAVSAKFRASRSAFGQCLEHQILLAHFTHQAAMVEQFWNIKILVGSRLDTSML